MRITHEDDDGDDDGKGGGDEMTWRLEEDVMVCGITQSITLGCSQSDHGL